MEGDVDGDDGGPEADGGAMLTRVLRSGREGSVGNLSAGQWSWDVVGAGIALQRRQWSR